MIKKINLFLIIYFLIFSGCARQIKKINIFDSRSSSDAISPVISEISSISPQIKWNSTNSLYLTDNNSLIINDDCQNDSNYLFSAIDYSLNYLNKLDKDSGLQFGQDIFTIEELKSTLVDFKNKLYEYDLSDTFYDYISENYLFYKSAADTVLFTGYYEPLLNGSFVKNEKYRYPLYRTPDNFYKIALNQYPFYSNFEGLPRIIRGRIEAGKNILPYYTREEIDFKNILYGQTLEILWCDNDIDVFFLHIQGSGIVQLSDTHFVRINYADQNGHTYKPIGRLLIEKNKIARENMSMQAIKKYLIEHPEEKEEIFSYNPSYVFFRLVDTGPLGNIEVPLTAYRSIATDAQIFPKGALCFIETEKPVFDRDNELIGWLPFRRFVLNQDTGGAIKGPGRVDLFTGAGKISEMTAGLMKQTGSVFFLIKKK